MYQPRLTRGICAATTTLLGLGCQSNILHQARGRHHYRPFTSEDEAQLTAVLTTKPRHVTRHIRQSMLHSRQRIAQFRNAVTYLMILLQSQLQKKQIDPLESTVLLESLLKECVELRQGDMAHLLFRASIRFRKYGVVVRYPMVRSLYDSYRHDNSKELMLGMAEELRNDPLLKRVAILAYQFGGDVDKATALLGEVSRETLETSDYCAFMEGFGVTGHYGHTARLVDEILEEEKTMVARGIEMNKIFSAAIVALRGDRKRMEAVVQNAVACGVELSDAAMGAILRVRLAHQTISSVSVVYELEKQLRDELSVDSLGMSADTAVIGKCSEIVARDHSRGDEIMLDKVEHLRNVIYSAIDNEDLDSIEAVYPLALIKGYGVLGRFDDMRQVFNKLREAGVAKDHRLYDEMMKWYAYAYNLKEVIALKEEMTEKHIYHTHYTYHNVFRVLDKYYPRMVEKYLTEMRSKGMSIELFMYPTLMRVFSELGDTSTVEALYREVRSKMTRGTGSTSLASTVIQMLQCYQSDPVRCEAVIRDAEHAGLLAHEGVQAAVVQFYSLNDKPDDLKRFLSRVPRKSNHLYRVLLQDASRRKDKPAFQLLLKEIQDSLVPMNERLFSAIITGLSLFRETDGVRDYIQRAVSASVVQTPMFFADAASAFARVGDVAATDQCWNDLLTSKMAITMPIYNRFLDLYMTSNNIPKVQEVLDTMMQLVPPNPVTATTVLDMLGKMGRLTEMESVLAEMTNSTNAAPTLVTYHQAMNAYAKAGEVAKMERIRERIANEGYKENHVTYNILFEGYGRAKRYEHLQELYEERKLKNIPMEEYGYIVLLNIYARGKIIEYTESLVEEMVTQGVPFSSRMLATVANSFSCVGNLPQMEHYITLLLSHPECRLRDVESVFVIYARARNVVKIQELLDTARLPKSELIYNICVGAFARAGEHSKVAFLLMQMEENGFTLSRNTSVTLSTLLLKAGKLELAQTVLKWKGMGLSEMPSAENSAAADTIPAVDTEPLQELMQEEVNKVRGHLIMDETDEDPLPKDLRA